MNKIKKLFICLAMVALGTLGFIAVKIYRNRLYINRIEKAASEGQNAPFANKGVKVDNVDLTE